MASLRLKRILDEKLAERCASENLHTVEEFLSKSEIELLEMLSLSVGELNEVLKKIYRKGPAPRTAYEMFKDDTASLVLYDGSARVDFNPGIITELVGSAGAGKTQCCMTLAAMAGLPVEHGGFGGGTLYFDTESSFSPSRLVEIARERYPNIYNTQALKRLISNVHVYQTNKTQELVKKLEGLDAFLIEEKIKLIILDSIALPFRSEFDGKHIPARQRLLNTVASKLKYFSDTFGLPVVTTNQVTTKFSKAEYGAALGITWAHAVNVRYRLNCYDSPTNDTAVRREWIIEKSPCSPSKSLQYAIDSGGVVFE
ncbi:hypothetical protein AAMO2058_000664100 [Amorphochlora amoebiformis]